MSAAPELKAGLVNVAAGQGVRGDLGGADSVGADIGGGEVGVGDVVGLDLAVDDVARADLVLARERAVDGDCGAAKCDKTAIVDITLA